MRTTSPGAVVALATLLVAGGCGDAGPTGDPAMTVRDSAGVRVVENVPSDRPAVRSAVELAELRPPDSALAPLPWGVDADPESGRIYALDGTAPRVVVFGEEGDYVGTLGREGGGPGEFRNPSALTVREDGVLVVWDTGRGVLSRWSPEGELLGEKSAPTVSYWGPGLHLFAGRLVTVTSRRSRTARRQMLVEARLGDTVGTRTDTTVLSTVRQEMSMVNLPCVQTPMPRVLEPTIAWTASGAAVYAVNGTGYRIDVFRGGDLARSIRRPTVAPIDVTSEMAVARARLQYRGFLSKCGISAEQLVEEVGHAERITPIRWLTVDPDGRLWVTRGAGHLAAERVDVLSADGRYLETLEVPAMPVAFVSANRFVGLRLRRETGRILLSLYDLEGRRDTATTGRGRDAERPAWAPPVRDDLREFRDCPECPVMVELPAGEYLMGAPEGEAPAAEIPTRPEHTERAEKPRVDVGIGRPFAIGKYEVTFDQWEACVEAGGCEYRPGDEGWGRGDRPVIHVARTDAKRYVEWLSERTGEEYRLPSEAEWEYAARAGTETARWWGGELGEGRLPCDGCGTRWDDQSTAPVGSFPANPWGLHDMLSNVTEWVADCWHESHAGHPGDASPRIESSPWWREEGWEGRRGEQCKRPVTRGGAYAYYPWTLRAAHRSFYFPNPNWYERKSYTRGFRVARAIGERSERDREPEGDHRF